MIISFLFIFFSGFFLGQYLTDKNWSDNANSYLRHEYKGHVYKVMYVDDDENGKTPGWDIKFTL